MQLICSYLYTFVCCWALPSVWLIYAPPHSCWLAGWLAGWLTRWLAWHDCCQSLKFYGSPSLSDDISDLLWNFNVCVAFRKFSTMIWAPFAHCRHAAHCGYDIASEFFVFDGGEGGRLKPIWNVCVCVFVCVCTHAFAKHNEHGFSDAAKLRVQHTIHCTALTTMTTLNDSVARWIWLFHSVNMNTVKRRRIYPFMHCANVMFDMHLILRAALRIISSWMDQAALQQNVARVVQTNSRI